MAKERKQITERDDLRVQTSPYSGIAPALNALGALSNILR